MGAAGTRITQAVLAAAVTAGLLGSPVALAREDLETRVGRLERLLDSQTLVDMTVRIDDLQREVRSLRGQLELQARQLQEMEDRQKTLYRDLDQRLNRITSAPPPPLANDPGVAPPPTGMGTPPPTTTPPPSSSTALSEPEAYQQAFDQLRQLHYGPAIEAFRNYLTLYPQGANAHLAQYWLGEAYYTQGNFKQSREEYQRLLDRFPQSPRSAEAMLKIGYSNRELGDNAAARKVLDDLIRRFPDSTEANQARNLLMKLR